VVDTVIWTLGWETFEISLLIVCGSKRFRASPLCEV
jgi:hypothetical protein